MIDSPRLIRSVPDAPWLPAGSTAEVWAGTDVEVPSPTVIVRLLVQRGPELFCVQTPKGLDIPTLFLGEANGWRPASAGITDLTSRYFAAGLPTRCVGFVRNVVPIPDPAYHLPAPIAHVPVFMPRAPAPPPPSAAGTWVPAADAPALLADRHWWPIACEALGWPPAVPPS
jgi:hypothetical protein